MLSTDDRRPRRGSRRTALAAVAGPALLLLLLGGCAGAPDEPPAPTAGGGAPPAEDPATPSESEEPSEEPTASGTPSPTDVPSQDPAPSADPAPSDSPSDEPSDPAAPTDSPDDESPDDDGSSGDGSATAGWKAPADPTAEGPTAAPALPEVHGGAEEEIVLPTGIEVSLISVTTTTLEAETPGEYSGPAVIVEVRVDNGSEEPQDVDSAVVSLVADDGEAGVPTWASPYAPFQGEVPAGGSASGTYVFMLDPAPQRAVTVSVNPSAGEPLAVFAGKTS